MRTPPSTVSGAHNMKQTEYGPRPVLEAVLSSGVWAACTQHGGLCVHGGEGARPKHCHAHPATTLPTSLPPLPRPCRASLLPTWASSLRSLEPSRPQKPGCPHFPASLLLYFSSPAQGSRLCSEVGLRTPWLPGSHCRATDGACPQDGPSAVANAPHAPRARPALQPAPASAPKPDRQATQEAGAPLCSTSTVP